MLRTLVVLLLLHALLLQVTAEPAASTAAAAKPKKEKRKKAPKEEVDIFADDYEDEEEEELFPPPSWDEQQMMYEGFVKQDSDGDGEINREDFIEFLAMSLVDELYSHKGIKSEINSAAADARLRFGTRRCSARSSSSPASRSARALCRGCCCGE